jgi:hypothetical protein
MISLQEHDRLLDCIVDITLNLPQGPIDVFICCTTIVIILRCEIKNKTMQEQTSSSSEQIKSTLEYYQTQLATVTSLYENDPDNPNYQKLMNDLQEAIRLTESLLSLKQASNDQQQQQQEEEESNTPQFNVNDYVLGLYQNVWYVGKVTRVEPSSTTTTTSSTTTTTTDEQQQRQYYDYYVKYVGYGNSDILNVEKRNIRKYVDPPKQYVTPGTKCLAIFDKDQLFYESIIDTVTDHGSVWVTFTGYNNIQEVPLPHIRLTNHSEIYEQNYKPKKSLVESDITTTTATSGTKRKDAPSNDNKKQPPKKKQKKKPQVSKAEQELNSRQNSWQSFLNKKGGGTKKTTSMFKSPESLSGKVGVIGSDKPMTQQQNQFKPLVKKSSNTNK